MRTIVQIEYRWAEGYQERLPTLAEELVRLKVALILAGVVQAAVASRDAIFSPDCLVAGGVSADIRTMTEVTANTAPAAAEAPDVATPPETPDPPARRLTPTAVALLARDDGSLVLRAESPDAVGGAYNVDRDENSPQARRRMRSRGQELALQYGVQFIDYTLPEPPVLDAKPEAPTIAKPAPKRAPLSAGPSQSEGAIRHRAVRMRYAVHRSRCRGQPTAEDRHEYRLVTAGDEVVLGPHFDATLQDIAAYLEARMTPADAPPSPVPGTSETTVRRRAKRLGYAESKSRTGFQLIAPGGELVVGRGFTATTAEIAAYLATKEEPA